MPFLCLIAFFSFFHAAGISFFISFISFTPCPPRDAVSAHLAWRFLQDCRNLIENILHFQALNSPVRFQELKTQGWLGPRPRAIWRLGRRLLAAMPPMPAPPALRAPFSVRRGSPGGSGGYHYRTSVQVRERGPNRFIPLRRLFLEVFDEKSER